MLDPITTETLDRFARRRRLLILLRCAAIVVLAFIFVMSLVAVCDYVWILSDSVRLLLSLVAYGVTALALWGTGLRYLGRHDALQAARQLQAAEPRVQDELLSAVEFSDSQNLNGSVELHSRLQSIVARRLLLLDISRLLPLRLVRHWLAGAGWIAIVCLLLLLIPPLQFGRRLARAALPVVAIERASLTRVTILHPAPPSRFVAAGDAVAVEVQVDGKPTDRVSLEFRSDGMLDSSAMRPRRVGEPDAASDSADGDRYSNALYAANLNILDGAVDYRIVAGDAVTLWQTLTPIARPSVDLFEVRYKFPSYAGLADVMESREDAHLEAIIGTTAYLKIHFDQPVHDARLVYDNQDVPVLLQPLDASETTFTVSVPIESPATYHVDAASIESGLENPFSPRYTITPLSDSTPLVRLDKSQIVVDRSASASDGSRSVPRHSLFADAYKTGETKLVSPLDVALLAGTVYDDLPIDRVFYELSINGSETKATPIVQTALPVDKLPTSEFAVNVTVDLFDLSTEQEPSDVRLRHGDVVRIRLAAIDRADQKGTSKWAEFFVVDEAFDQTRHAFLHTIYEIAIEIVSWTKNASEAIDEMSAKDPTIFEQKELLLKRLTSTLADCYSEPRATNLEWIGKAIIDLESELKLVAESKSKSEPIKKQLSELGSFAQSLVSHHLLVAVLADVASLHHSLEPMTDEQTDLPIHLFERYIRLAEVRLSAIDRLIRQYDGILTDSERRPLTQWLEFSGSWQIRLRNALTDPPGETNLRALMQQFSNDLKGRRNHNLIQDNLTGELHRRSDRLNQQTRSVSREIRESSEEGRQIVRLLDQLRQFESLHRSRVNVDLDYASDLDLVRGAIKFINSDGFPGHFPGSFEIQPKAAQREVASAFAVLENAHQAIQWKGELYNLISSESQLNRVKRRQFDGLTYASARGEHPYWMLRFDRGMEQVAKTFYDLGIDRTLVEPYEQIRHRRDFRWSFDQLNERRWRGDELQSVDLPLRNVFVEMNRGLESLEPIVTEARAIIRRYVPSLAEQATQAADAAAKAKERIENREDASAETTQTLAEQQQIAAEAAAETMQRLADAANTADLSDASQQQLARDADAAASQIGRARARAEASMQRATAEQNEQTRREQLDRSAESLDQLEKSLRLTADHFERAENNEDLTKSRSELAKGNEQESSLQPTERQERFEQAAQIAKVGKSSPEDLLRQLEAELKRNQPMQRALAEITDDTTQSAIAELQSAANKQKDLNNRFESSDPAIREQKKRHWQRLEGLARQAAAVQGAILSRAARTAEIAKQSDLQNQIRKMEQELQAISQRIRDTNREDRLLSDIHQSTKQTQQEIAAVQKQLTQIEETLAKVAESEPVENSEELKRMQRDSRQAQVESRNHLSRELQNEADWWSKNAGEANSRIGEAQRQSPVADERAEAAARASKAFAEQKQADAGNRKNKVEQMRIEPVDKPNPAAEAASLLVKQADQAMSEVAGELASMVEETSQVEVLNPQATAVESAQHSQREISDSAVGVVDQLSRAGRHAQRLEDRESAQRHAQATASVQQNAVEPAQQSEATIGSLLGSQRSAEQNAQPDAERSDQQGLSDVGRQIAKTTAGIEAEAQRLAGVFQNDEVANSQPDSRGAATAGDNEAEQQRAMQLARTLDELDRVVFPSANSRVPNASGSSQQNGESNRAQSLSSADASPTLSAEMNEQAQAIASERQEQIAAAAKGSSAANESRSSATPMPSPSASSASASTPESAGGVLPIDGNQRFGEGDWGQLRQRGREDALDNAAIQISPKYQSQIEAYFEAVARQSTRPKE